MIVNMLDSYLWVYFGGIDNSPVFDEKGDIIQERLEDFRMQEKKHAGSRFAQKLQEYLSLLAEEEYKRTQAVEEYLKDLTFF